MIFKKSQIQKKMKNHQFWHPFWHHFGSLLGSFFNAFSASIFAFLFGCLRGLGGLFQNSCFFWLTFFPVFLRFFIDFGSHFGSILASFWHHFGITFSSIILASFFFDFSSFLEPSNRRNAINS